MSEYWKSLPRKFCDICKCWFADNKASIDFHERGKRHQENAAKRIHDIKKKGIKDAKKQKKYDDDMAKIEKAALAAYKKDLQNEAVSELEEKNAEEILNDVTSARTETIPTSNVFQIPKPKTKNKLQKTVDPAKTVDPPKTASKIWYEAMTDEGYKYYWNTENSESRWEPPEEGYVSLEEQAETNVKDVTQVETNVEDITQVETNVEDNTQSDEVSNTNGNSKVKTTPTCAVGPQPKIDPYGQWVTVVNEEPEEIDLQLPAPSEDTVEVVIPISTNEPKFKIKEKVIGALMDADPSEEVTFKKRKFGGSQKRNTRQRTDDD